MARADQRGLEQDRLAEEIARREALYQAPDNAEKVGRDLAAYLAKEGIEPKIF
jgi:F0F1-type ATP synthase gamma subunit